MSTEQVRPMVTADDLRPVDLFDDLDRGALAEWAAVAEPRSAQPGEVVISGEGPAAGLWCLLEGTLQTFLRDGERLEPVGHQNAPTWIGAVPTLTETPITARMVALTAADDADAAITLLGEHDIEAWVAGSVAPAEDAGAAGVVRLVGEHA